jgi:hypothetical protein
MGPEGPRDAAAAGAGDQRPDLVTLRRQGSKGAGADVPAGPGDEHSHGSLLW